LHQACEHSKSQGDVLQDQVRSLEQEFNKARTYSEDLERAIQTKKDEANEKHEAVASQEREINNLRTQLQAFL
jgi:chromosome segregation ATPase